LEGQAPRAVGLGTLPDRCSVRAGRHPLRGVRPVPQGRVPCQCRAGRTRRRGSPGTHRRACTVRPRRGLSRHPRRPLARGCAAAHGRCCPAVGRPDAGGPAELDPDVSALRSLTRRGRGLPDWVQLLARRGMLELGRATVRWRTEPDFLVIGAQRSGTTTLFRVLSQHPQLLRPTVSKGVGYFDTEYHRGRRWYTAHFPLRLTARLHGPGTQVFESSGYYAFHPLAARRIAADLPGVKVVMMVRDPVERAYSAHSHELARGFETEEFEAAVRLEPQRTAGEAERLARDEGYSSHTHRHHAYLARGRYAEQLERFGDHLGRDRV